VSGEGRPDLQLGMAKNLKLAIVAGQWHPEISEALVAGAKRVAKQAQIEDPTLIRVAGAIEYVCDAVTAGLTRVALDEGVPVGNGVLTTDTEKQALDRSGLPGSVEDKGGEACAAAIDTAVTLAQLRRKRTGSTSR
jgi:6,7-dimethyl-8-ribityllumazine synthase